ncbi:GNAT family N-acetyltransferase [Heyndrickxia acidicola]|uniref:GNAT family protein n=1 Tax=Heyndrickxia acidicola TaxID=209389 RepID=A0ABU6MCT6_9BACI|nr:GNAT family protein [Heyndrickxia acidicola]MED1202325.1 GNAT family protein [Heyndrickxia acidicola]
MDALLHSEMISLTSITEADLPILLQWYRDTEFLRLFDALPASPRTESSLKEWIKHTTDSHNGYLFGIRRNTDQQLLGFVELDRILWNHRVCGLAIAIGDKDHRGKGLGQHALELVLTFVFDELNLHRVQLTVFDYNTRAIKLYEKLGFKHEGRYRDFIQRNGERYDMHLYGLLQHEWEKSISN